MKRQLTFWESVCLIAGGSIGGGILAIPYIMNQVGWTSALVIVAIAFGASLLFHWMIADMLLKSKDGGELLSALRVNLFRGRWRSLLSSVYFALLTIFMLSMLSAYITGGAEILSSLLPLPQALSEVIFYVCAAGLTLFGLKAVGFGEKFTVPLIIAIAVSLFVFSLLRIQRPLLVLGGSPSAHLGLFGMFMFSFSALLAVPQVVEGLCGHKKKVGGAIAVGLGINLVVALLIAVGVILSSNEVTSMAVIGWSAALGPVVRLLSSLFVIFAMITSYWSISLAFSDMIRGQFGWNRNVCWLMATLPTLLLALFAPKSYLSFLQIAGGAVAAITALLLIPAYRNATRNQEPSGILGRFGHSRTLLFTVFILYVLMSVVSFSLA